MRTGAPRKLGAQRGSSAGALRRTAALALVVGLQSVAAASPAFAQVSATRAAASAPALGSALQSTLQSAAVPRAAAVIRPDTLRVGEPFLLGVIVRVERGTPLVFPVRLELPEPLEQVEPVEVRAGPEDGTSRAYYRLVAWRAGVHELPPVRIGWRAGGEERGILAHVPSLEVTSVLAGAPGEPDLRGPRPFLRAAAPPWPWILAGLLLLAAVAAAFARWRRRGPAEPTPAAPSGTPAERALRSLEALRARWAAGGLEGGEFFDRWESVLRRYVESTRDWPAGVPLRALADGHRPLAEALERSALVRFARLGAERDGPPAAVTAAEDWIRAAERVR